MRIASIDIGTNTILMLIVESIGNLEFHILNQQFSTPRLGEGVDKNGIISQNAIDRALEVLINYKKICNDYKVDVIKAVGTSALRDAKNSSEVLKIFKSILNYDVEVISGENEAYLSFIGSVNSTKRSLLIDIGGGSTELIIGENNQIQNRISLQIGAVRITEKFFKNIYPINDNFYNDAINYIKEQLNNFKIDSKIEFIYSVAGTPCSIATALKGIPDYEVDKVDGEKIYIEDIQNILNKFKLMNPNEISEKYLINPKRADIIAAGTLILYLILQQYNLNYTIVSSKGLRFGIIKDFLIKNFESK